MPGNITTKYIKYFIFRALNHADKGKSAFKCVCTEMERQTKKGKKGKELNLSV